MAPAQITVRPLPPRGRPWGPCVLIEESFNCHPAHLVAALSHLLAVCLSEQLCTLGLVSMSEESPPAPISTAGFAVSELNLLPRPLKAPFILVPTGSAGVGGGVLH